LRFPKTQTFFILATTLIVGSFAGAQQKNVGPSSAGPGPNAVRPYVACAAAIPALPPRAHHKSFTQRQVVITMRDGFGDDWGVKPMAQYIDIPLDKYSLRPLSCLNVADVNINWKTASMGSVKDIQTYCGIEDAVHRLCQEAHAPAMAYDFLAWDSQHPSKS